MHHQVEDVGRRGKGMSVNILRAGNEHLDVAIHSVPEGDARGLISVVADGRGGPEAVGAHRRLHGVGGGVGEDDQRGGIGAHAPVKLERQ